MGDPTKDRRLIYLIASCIACLALWFVVPYLAIPKHSVVLYVLAVAFLTFVGMFVQLSIPRWFTSLTVKPLAALAVLLVSAGLWLGIVFAIAAPYTRYDVKDVGYVVRRIKNPPKIVSVTVPIPPEKGNPGSVRSFTAKGVRCPSNFGFKLFAFNRFAGMWRTITSLLMILAATSFGYLLSFILRNPNIVLPVATFAIYMDIWTVLVGPTSKALEKAPHIVYAVSVAQPDPGSASAGFAPISFIGPADFIFTAMFLGVLYRLNMEPRRTFWMLLPALVILMLAVMQLPIPGLPALVVIGPATIIANRRHFKLKRDEWIAMGVVGVLLTVVTFALIPAMNR